MIRTTLGILVGAVASALALFGCCHLALTLHPLPPGADLHSLQAITTYLQAAPAKATACLVAGVGLAALVGSWLAALIGRPHRGGVALVIGAVLTVAVLVIAALVPQPDWMPVLAMLLPIPLALCAWRLATPRMEM
jgi:acyl-CoA synthetase (AMP-forming)/AMP-acid ligase II